MTDSPLSNAPPPAFRCSVFIATSLDGFIAREDGAIDWLERANETVTPGEDCGYAEFMKTVDVLIMGRGTFDTVCGFATWPYGDKPVWVLSQSLRELPRELPNTVRLLNRSPTEVVARAKEMGYSRLYIDGGRTIQSFSNAGLITDFTITLIPVLIGKGLPLFAAGTRDVTLRHAKTIAYDFGFVQNQYEVVGPA
jgi:dihydrofolate reductase